MSRTSMILRDVLYTAMAVMLIMPGSPLEMSISIRLIIAVLIIATRVWQHINYYKATGKIY
ncbi:hypothetical protein [Mucilaginibacter antarcticus]|uniref:Uncharacterized protein n=1 Tax=Mucilaginibacter antarcticus TaxID=1855725 RepID=A0ABW5XQY4_9SPHI